MTRSTFLLALALLALPSPASAQRTLTHDTMSMSSPVAVSCGFCAMEAYGVLFQRITATSGLQPTDFPLVVQNIQLALGAAEVTGSPAVCHGIAVPAVTETLVHVEIWAGTGTPPMSATITSMPVVGMAWPGEDLVISLDDVPVTMSTPETDGGSNFNLMLNTLGLDDGTTPAPTVADGHTYLRVVVALADGGMSSSCTPATSAPTGFPLRDDDGVVTNQRSFLYAQGVGWLWNEGAGVHGDWGIRLTVNSLPRGDAGTTSDAGGTTSDTGVAPVDSGTGGSDAGTTPGGGGGCSCRVGAHRTSGALAALALALVLYGRKVTRPKRAGTWKSPSSGGDHADGTKAPPSRVSRA